jgi:SAM-dependent methyltransferase
MRPMANSRSRLVAQAADLAAATRSIPLLGRRMSCPLCGWSFRFFTRGGSSIRRKPDGYCPRCNAKARHRWLWLNLADVLPEFERPGLDVLHIAPAYSTYRAITKMALGSYVPVDRAPSARAVARFDLCSPALVPASFDVAVCIHVLEHLDDDRVAIQALRELVRPGGLVVIGVPVHGDQLTLEDPTITDPAERVERFGEPDHRRCYGFDIVDRLEDAGLEVDARVTADAPSLLLKRYGLTKTEGLFLCRRQL